MGGLLKQSYEVQMSREDCSDENKDLWSSESECLISWDCWSNQENLNEG